MRFRVLILAIIGLLQFNTEGGVISTSAQTGQWVNIVENSDLEGDDMSCFFTRENLDEDIEVVPSTIVDGAGLDGSRGIVVHSVDNPSETWNTQLFVRLTQSLPAGTRYRFSFDCKASQKTSVSMQSHEEPGVYIHWDFGGTLFTTSWQHYEAEGIISEEMSKDDVQMRTVAFNLAEIATATTFYFDNIVFEIYEGEDDPTPMSWTNIVTNSDLEGDDVSCFFSREDYDKSKDTEPATIVDGAGVDDSRGIVVQSVDNPSESWNTQFFVRLPQSLPAGTKYRFSFDHKASQEANVAMQCHDEPSDFIYYGFGGDVSVTTSWGHYEREGYITSDMSKADKQMRTIALDLAHNTTATTFYFDNIVFEIYQPQEEDKSVTISADDKTMVYGDDVPTLTFSSSGATLEGTPKLSTTATKNSPVGTYPIKVEKGSVTNEQVTYVHGTLTITKAPLTAKADDKTMQQGDEVPPLTVSYSGWKLGETENVLTKKPTASTTATSQSKPGTYSISVSGGEAQNYDFIYEKGTLTISESSSEVTQYTLSIKVSGGGYVVYDGNSIRNKTLTFSVEEGGKAVLNLVPDEGCKIKSVKVNDTDVTSSVTNNRYTINSITSNTTLAVTFETIPVYTLSIKASGNGYVAYDGNTIRSKTSTFSVEEGGKAVLNLVPDEGYRIKSVKVDGQDVTTTIVNKQYVINNMSANTLIWVAFEADPLATYTLSISSSGNGSATYNNTVVRGKTQDFTVNGGTSATITFTPDEGGRIASVKVNDTDVTSSVTNNKYTINSITSNTTLAVTFETIPVYTLSIKASGNGYVAYDGNTIRSKTSTFSVVGGTNAILKFAADEGNKIKSVKVDGQDVTSEVINNQYTINNITANTAIWVAFEPLPSYTLSITSSGNGSAKYNSSKIRGKTQSFTVVEGSSATIQFASDTGYRIASVTVNDKDVTASISNNSYTISSISENTTLTVTFEAIPPTTYSLTINSIGNGTVTYDGTAVRGSSQSFTVVEGSYVTVQITPDDRYRLKQVTLDGKDVTADVANDQYTTGKIAANTILTVEFEAVPTYTLTIKSSAFGSVKYDDTVIMNQTETFSVQEGSSAVLTFMADGNGRLLRITLNGNDITGELKNGQYTISDIRANQSVEAEYIEDFTKVTFAGVAYTVTSYDEGTVVLAAGNYGQVLTVPATFEAKGKTWLVTGLAEDALKDNQELAAIVWKPEILFTGEVGNPNLLLYVKRAKYAPSNIQNVVEGNTDEGEALQADNIVLTEAENGNNFYCPIAFTAKRISYEHNYSMISGYNTCQGWETLVLPFDVSMIINAKGTELVPYSVWQQGGSRRPFWLYQLTESGWQAGKGIKANVPYIISIPNNEVYQSSYNVAGNIEFIGNNVEVKASDDMTTGQNGNKRFVANYQNKAANNAIYAMNVSNLWCQNTDTEREGSVFIRNLRNVHPFEAYMTIEGSNAPTLIPVFDGTADVRWMIEDIRDTRAADGWYDLQGRKLQGEPTQKGIYIYKGKKVKR